MTPLSENFDVPLSEALEMYLQASPCMAPRTMLDYRRYIADLESVFMKHLGASPLLTEINSATVSLFQRERKKMGVSNGYANKEVGALRTIMKWAGLWS